MADNWGEPLEERIWSWSSRFMAVAAGFPC